MGFRYRKRPSRVNPWLATSAEATAASGSTKMKCRMPSNSTALIAIANATGKTIPTLRMRYTSTCFREIRVRPRARASPPRIGAHNRRTRISSGNARATWVGRYVHGKLEADEASGKQGAEWKVLMREEG